MDGSLSDDQVHAWLQEIVDGRLVDGVHIGSYISLHFQTPAMGGSSYGEIAGGGYHRYRMSWSQPQNRAIWTMEDARFTGLMPSRVTYFGVWDSPNKGMLRGYGELPSPATILSGKGYILGAGEIAISLG